MVKEEVRTLLTNRHITKFTMRPVKRTYAFEDQNLPRGQQYVLKVKFPASHAPLPLGLTGMIDHCTSHTPYHTMYHTPHLTPYHTPYHTVHYTPYHTVHHTPYHTPYHTQPWHPGDTFAGVLGANTSMLESLLLKRKIMGPSWMLLQQSRRVQQGQVCWW